MDQKMTSICHPLLGFLTAVLAMTVVYIGLWLCGVGGFRGMYGDDSYPLSIVLVPVSGMFLSALVFIIAIFPSVQLARWLTEKERMTNRKRGFAAIWIAMLFGGAGGLLRCDLPDALFGCLYLGVGTMVFWFVAIKDVQAVLSKT